MTDHYLTTSVLRDNADDHLKKSYIIYQGHSRIWSDSETEFKSSACGCVKKELVESHKICINKYMYCTRWVGNRPAF